MTAEIFETSWRDSSPKGGKGWEIMETGMALNNKLSVQGAVRLGIEIVTNQVVLESN